MNISIKKLTKKQIIITCSVVFGVVALMGIALLVSNFFKDEPAISVGEVTIYRRDYEKMVKQAEEANISRQDFTDILIEYYKTKEAARSIGLNIPEGYIEHATKRLQDTSSGNLPDNIAMMQSYGSAVRDMFVYGQHEGMHGRIVWAPYRANGVENEAILKQDKAKSLIDNAYNELKNNNSDKGIDELYEANINMPPSDKYLFTKDGRFIKEDGVDTYKRLPVSSSAVAKYMETCTDDKVCAVAEEKEKAVYFFIQNYFRIEKVDVNLADKLEAKKQEIKVVDYVN